MSHGDKREGLSMNERKRKPGTQNYFAAHDTNMAIIPNADIQNLQYLQNNLINRKDPLDRGKLSNYQCF